jgi:uncharacterized protein YndB with AHSA1/START domain
VNHIASAERDIAASADTLFTYLADLEQHWQLAGPSIEVVSLERPSGRGPARGGVVCMRGPLGIRRAARTRVVEADPPTRLAGSAEVGSATLARVSWALRPDGERTRVRLEATVEHASSLDRALLALGGRRWLERRFAAILETLERRVSEPSQSVPA